MDWNPALSAWEELESLRSCGALREVRLAQFQTMHAHGWTHASTYTYKDSRKPHEGIKKLFCSRWLDGGQTQRDQATGGNCVSRHHFGSGGAASCRCGPVESLGCRSWTAKTDGQTDRMTKSKLQVAKHVDLRASLREERERRRATAYASWMLNSRPAEEASL